MANVYYSVGQNSTDHKTGTPTCSVSGGIITFSAAQTATNLGVGDRVTLASGEYIYYLASKISSTQWYIVDALGGAPGSHLAGTPVDSIAHEYTSLSAAEAGASDVDHLNTTDLATGNYTLHFPCYYDSGNDTTIADFDGWTTSETYCIKIYTPKNTKTECNLSQRHSGVWNASKYILKTNAGTTASLIIQVNHVHVIGIQISVTGYGSYNGSGINIASTITNANTGIIDSNIIRCEWDDRSRTNGGRCGIDAPSLGTPPKVYYMNNIVYDFYDNGGTGKGLSSSKANYCHVWAYNNTVHNCDVGIRGLDNGNSYAKNNVVNDCTTCYTGTFYTAGCTNNNSDDGTQPGANSSEGDVLFLNEGSDDFRLSASDTTAKGYGIDLTNDANLKVGTDIEDSGRGAVWDIGASQVSPTNVYYSVGQNATDHKTGTPTGAISSGVLTFSAAQTSTALGAGDRVTFSDGTVVYLAVKTSTTVWSVITAKGGTPINKSSTSISSIAHEYTALVSAEAGASDGNHIGKTDLTRANVALHFPCYYDSGFDTDSVEFSSMTTGADYFIKIYTPKNINTECNQSQRGTTGVWDASGAYTIRAAYHIGTIRIMLNHVFVEGLQISNLGTSSYSGSGVYFQSSPLSNANTGKIDSNIIRAEWTNRAATLGTASGITLATAGVQPHHFISNNIIYDFYRDANNGKGLNGNSYSDGWFYNNTVHNCDIGINGTGNGDIHAKNNIAQDCDTCYSGTFSGTCINNCSDDGTQPGTSGRNGEVAFINEGSDNFHLSPSDTVAKGYGANLTSDSDYPISTDIDGETRPASGAWDIGADEIFPVTSRDHAVGAGIARGIMRKV